MFMLLLGDCPLLKDKLTALEQFAIIFSASAHDVDHPVRYYI